MLDEEPPRTGPGAGRWVGVVAVIGLVGSVISSSASSEKDWNFRSKNVIFLTFKKTQWVKKLENLNFCETKRATGYFWRENSNKRERVFFWHENSNETFLVIFKHCANI